MLLVGMSGFLLSQDTTLIYIRPSPPFILFLSSRSSAVVLGRVPGTDRYRGVQVHTEVNPKSVYWVKIRWRSEIKRSQNLRELEGHSVELIPQPSLKNWPIYQDEGNMETPHRKGQGQEWVSNTGPSCCDATMLNIWPPCCSKEKKSPANFLSSAVCVH